MKKIPVIFLLALIVFSGIMSECAKKTGGKNFASTQRETESGILEGSIEIVEKTDTEVIEFDLPDGFKQLSDAELKSVSDFDSLIEIESDIKHEMGVNEIITSIYGNY